MLDSHGKYSTGVGALAFASAATALAVPLAFAIQSPYVRIDSDWYLYIARGEMSRVIQPFSSRPLAPLLARWLANHLHLSLLQAFLAIGIASVFFLAFTLASLLLRSGVAARFVWALLPMFFWGALLGNSLLPDPFSAALLAAFVLCLWQEEWFAAALLFFPMFLARESTILALVCFLAVAWKQMLWRARLGAIAASLAGMAVVHHLAATGQANRHQLSPLLYMAGKVPWNFFENVISLRPWTPSLTNFCAVPRWSATLPVSVAGAHVAGLCGWDPLWQPHTFALAFSSFGLLPLLALYLLRHHRSALWPREIWLRFAIVYGSVAFGAAPLLGHTVERLLLYGWPLFLLAVPVAVSRKLTFGKRAWTLLALHAVLSMGFLFLYWTRDQYTVLDAWSCLLLVLLLNLAAWLLLRPAMAEPA